MSRTKTPSIPTYRLHKRSGQAVVSFPIGGGRYRDYYLGPFGTRATSPGSWSQYDRLIAEWLASGRALVTDAKTALTVAEVLDAYWVHAQDYYRRTDPLSGRTVATSQLERVRMALRPVRELYQDAEAARFGPLALKACRQSMIGRGLARTHVNQLVGCIKRCFAWAVSEEMIPPSVSEGLRTVRGLLAGRTEAAEREHVKPVADEHIKPVQAVVLPQVRDLIEFQLLTACRPGEAVLLRPCDLDRGGAIWRYRPLTHKTAHHGHDRSILIGPRCQELLGPYLGRDPWSFCFSAAEAAATRLQSLGQESRLRSRSSAGDHYTVDTYRAAIRRGCDKAGVPRWHPHQLRHSAATRLAQEFGIEVARIILGHRTINVTRMYAEENHQRAAEVMAKVG